MQLINVVRYACFAWLLLCSLVCLGVGAHFSSLLHGFTDTVFDFVGMNIAVGVITLVVICATVIIDFVRRGAITSIVAVELGWSFVLMILWVAAAGLSTGAFAGTVRGCEGLGGICSEYQAIQAFGWLAWLTILGWFVFLLAASIISHTRGNTGVWTQPVTDTDFFAYKNNQYPQQGAPMQQQYGAPMQASYPPQGHQQV